MFMLSKGDYAKILGKKMENVFMMNRKGQGKVDI